MINTKRLLIVATLIAGVIILVLSFKGTQRTLVDDFLSYQTAVEDLELAVESDTGVEQAIENVEAQGENLDQWAEQLSIESANKWDSFEANWPSPPTNWRCHLECTYQYWRCTNELGGETFYCLSKYGECARNC